MSSNRKKSVPSDHESGVIILISPALNQLDPYLLYILENRNLEDEYNVLNDSQELKVQKASNYQQQHVKKL